MTASSNDTKKGLQKQSICFTRLSSQWSYAAERETVRRD